MTRTFHACAFAFASAAILLLGAPASADHRHGLRARDTAGVWTGLSTGTFLGQPYAAINVVHRASGEGEEVDAVVELGELRTAEPQVHLVDEVGRAQRVARALAAQVRRRQPVQRVVDLRQERIERATVARAMRAARA